MASTEVTSTVALLRAATRPAHDAVDAAFGGSDLAEREAYRRFLLAHARALPPAEGAMRTLAFARTLEPRTPLLTADLAELDTAMPQPLSLALPPRDEAALWGVLYVVEGSRLGGAMLAKMVGVGLPSRYLRAVHLPGQWRSIRQAIDDAGDGAPREWQQAALAGADATFGCYARAAEIM